MRWSFGRQLKQSTLPRLLLAIGCVGVGAGLVVVFVVLTRPQPPLPTSIRSRVTYAVFLPNTYATADQKSYGFADPSKKVLTFKAHLSDGQTITFTEQATPQPIIDIAGFYDQFVQQFHEYDSLDSYYGPVYLTHPNNAANQVAIMNAHGTLLFIRAANGEPEAVWLRIFNDLKVYQST